MKRVDAGRVDGPHSCRIERGVSRPTAANEERSRERPDRGNGEDAADPGYRLVEARGNARQILPIEPKDVEGTKALRYSSRIKT